MGYMGSPIPLKHPTFPTFHHLPPSCTALHHGGQASGATAFPPTSLLGPGISFTLWMICSRKTKRTWTILIFKIIWVLIEKQHNYNYNYKCTTDIIRLYKRLQGIAVYNDSKLQSISWFPGSPNKTKPVGREVGPTHTMQLAYLIWYTGIHCWL